MADYRKFDPIYARTEDENIASVLVYVDVTSLNIYKDINFKDPLKKDEAIDLYKKGSLVGALVSNGELTDYFRPFILSVNENYCTFTVGYTLGDTVLTPILAYTDEAGE